MEGKMSYKEEIRIVSMVALCTALLILWFELSVGWACLLVFLASLYLAIYVGYKRNKSYEPGKTKLCKDCDHFIKESELCKKCLGHPDYVNGNPPILYHASIMRDFGMRCGENGKLWAPKKEV
jgi:hypothetical protein